jgi:hypothetical protein
MGEGAGVQVSSDSEDFWLLATAAMFENSDPQGAADVAQAIYNRVAMPGDPWKVNNSIRKTILNPNQFQPVRKYGGYATWGRIKTKEDAIRFAKSHRKTQEQLERVAAALLDKSKQQSARQFVGPRDSFRSVSYENANNDLADDTEVRRHGHVFGFEPRGATIGAFRQGKLGAAEVNANVTGKVEYTDTHDGDGATSVGGKTIVEIGKNLISQKFAVAEHPDFTKKATPSGGLYTPGRGFVSNVHSGRGHYEGRAIDVTDWTSGYPGRYSAVLNSLQNNPSIKMLIYDGWGAMYEDRRKLPPGNYSHPTHMHIETRFHGGDITKDSVYNLHKGEYVVDKDSVDLIGVPFLATINSIENKTQLKQKIVPLIEHLNNFAPYEVGGRKEVIVEEMEPEIIVVDEIIPRNSIVALSSGNSYDYTEGVLYA